MNSKVLQNKKILFIAPVFYNYHELIIRKLESFSAKVIFFPERKSGFMFSIMNNISFYFIKKYQESYYNSIIDKIKEEDINYLFVIRGFMMPISFMKKIRQMKPEIKTIMYQWDSNKTNPYFHLVDSFDNVYSFDYKDCALADKLKYLPLFYTDDILECRKTNPQIDFFFMGSYLPERYAVFVRFKELLSQKKYTGSFFLYIPKSTYIKERLKGRVIDKSIVRFSPLSRLDYLELLKNSKIVVDVSNENQSGLAMRIIEAVGANKKILTSNTNIKNENIYNKERINFIDSNNLNFTEDFVENKLSNKCDDEIDNYSLTNWLLNIFNE